MKCKNVSCIYQEYDKCKLGDIEVDVNGKINSIVAFKLDGMCGRFETLKLDGGNKKIKEIRIVGELEEIEY